jgi:hypothetical protein
MDGKPVALVLIEGAQFGEDTEGNTTLDELKEVNEDEERETT